MARSPEHHLISSILRNRDARTAISNGVTLDMFVAFPDEWAWIEQYVNKFKKSPTRLAFKHKFPSFRILDVDDTGHFAEEVRKNYAHNMLVSSLDDIADLLTRGDIDKAIAAFSRKAVEVTAHTGTNDDSNVLDDFTSVLQEIEGRATRVRTDGMAGIPTGMPILDERLGGWQPGTYNVVAARLGEGKTWTLIGAAAAALAAGKTVQYNAMEMSRTAVAMRFYNLLSSTYGKQVFTSLSLMRGEGYDQQEFNYFLRTLKQQIAGRLHISDKARGKVSPLTIQAQIERNQPDIVFIDYITLLQKPGEGDWRSVGQVSSDLQALAQEYQIPVIGAAQLNRNAAVGREPAGAEDIAQADAIGQDADNVITIRAQSTHLLKMKAAKCRHASGGFKWYVHLDPDNGIFQQVTGDEADDIRDADLDAQDAL